MDWYQRLDHCLRERGWTKAELSKRAGVPFRDLVRYRATGQAVPSALITQKLALALGVDPEWLHSGETGAGDWAEPMDDADSDRSAFNLAVQVADRWEAELFGEANIIAHTTLVAHLYQYIVNNNIRSLDELGPAEKPPGW